MNPSISDSPSRMDRKRETTRQKVMTAALALIQERGLEETTMEQIAERADIAKGTLYHYFPVKEAIIHEYLQRESLKQNEVRILRMRQLPDTRTRMIVSLTELVAAVKAQKDLFASYFVYRIQTMISLDRNAIASSGLHLLEDEILRLGLESGELRSDQPFEILEALFEFTFIVIAQQFYRDPRRFNADRTIERCVDLFLSGAGSRSARRRKGQEMR